MLFPVALRMLYVFLRLWQYVIPLYRYEGVRSFILWLNSCWILRFTLDSNHGTFSF
jgi:hypothetical protein